MQTTCSEAFTCPVLYLHMLTKRIGAKGEGEWKGACPLFCLHTTELGSYLLDTSPPFSTLLTLTTEREQTQHRYTVDISRLYQGLTSEVKAGGGRLKVCAHLLPPATIRAAVLIFSRGFNGDETVIFFLLLLRSCSRNSHGLLQKVTTWQLAATLQVDWLRDVNMPPPPRPFLLWRMPHLKVHSAIEKHNTEASPEETN